MRHEPQSWLLFLLLDSFRLHAVGDAAACGATRKVHRTMMRRRGGLVILMEDMVSGQRLLQAITRRHPDVPVQVWNVSNGAIHPYQEPPTGYVYYSRVSPSARLRENPNAFQYGTVVLEWVRMHGRPIVNGLSAMRLDGSKFVQWLELDRSGFPRLDRLLVCDEAGATGAVIRHLRVPRVPEDMANQYATRPGDKSWYLKPDHGGSGAGVRRFSNASEVRRLADVEKKKTDEPLKGAPSEMYVFEETVDGTFQASRSGRTTAESRVNIFRTFYRAEFVGRRFLYVVRVHAHDEAKNLCPCENAHSVGVKFEIVPNPTKLFGRARWTDFERMCVDLMVRNEIDIISFEFGVNRHGMFVYDVNCNTNYNRPAEEEAGVRVGGYEAIADWLIQKLDEGTSGELGDSKRADELLDVETGIAENQGHDFQPNDPDFTPGVLRVVQRSVTTSSTHPFLSSANRVENEVRAEEEEQEHAITQTGPKTLPSIKVGSNDVEAEDGDGDEEVELAVSNLAE